MNVIFGMIILALFIIAIRVIWSTLFQTIAASKAAWHWLGLQWTQRQVRKSDSVLVLPSLPSTMDWNDMADTVRQEIHRRNSGFSEVDKLDAQLQARLKTIELMKVDIQIAKLEQELQKVKPAVVPMASEPAKKRKRAKSIDSTVVDEHVSKAPPQVGHLRAALKGGNVPMTPVNELARH
jgi:hypothetical protein